MIRLWVTRSAIHFRKLYGFKGNLTVFRFWFLLDGHLVSLTVGERLSKLEHLADTIKKRPDSQSNSERWESMSWMMIYVNLIHHERCSVLYLYLKLSRAQCCAVRVRCVTENFKEIFDENCETLSVDDLFLFLNVWANMWAYCCFAVIIPSSILEFSLNLKTAAIINRAITPKKDWGSTAEVEHLSLRHWPTRSRLALRNYRFFSFADSRNSRVRERPWNIDRKR